MKELAELWPKAYAAGWPSDPAGTGNTPAKLTDLETVFGNIVGFVTGLAVVVVFIMLVFGAFKFITSGGDAKATDSAKNTITYAIFGLIALIGIWLILRFIEVFTGVKVTEFKIQP